MVGLQYLCCTLTDDDTGGHGVTRHHARHDRAIRDAKVVDSVDLEVGVHDRQGIAPHFCGARLMVVSIGFVADEWFERSCGPQISSTAADPSVLKLIREHYDMIGRC